MRKHLGINIPRRVGADEEPMGFGFPSDRVTLPKGLDPLWDKKRTARLFPFKEKGIRADHIIVSKGISSRNSLKRSYRNSY